MTSKAETRMPGWETVERERRMDRTVRRICIAAWTVTFILVLVYAVLVGLQVHHTMQLISVGADPTMADAGSAMGTASTMAMIGITMPLVIALGILSVLVAALSTVGVFLRFRTASLAEIQLRLAALEGMLAKP